LARHATRKRREQAISEATREGGASLGHAERFALIQKALEHCGQPVTEAALRAQYHYETGEYPPRSMTKRRARPRVAKPKIPYEDFSHPEPPKTSHILRLNRR
jgi:hypothetical protein